MILFVIGTLCLVAFMAWGTYRTTQVLSLLPPGVNPLLLPAENGLRLILVLMCVGLGWSSGVSPVQLGWVSVEPGRDLGLGLAVGAVVALIVPPLTQLVVRWFGPQVYSPLVVKSIMPRNRRQWALVPAALVSAVLLEELLFRSLLLGGFAVFAPPFLLASIWSLAFGALHWPQGIFGAVVAAALGGLLSALFLGTGGLLAPFVAHYVINLVQLVLAARDKAWLDGYSSVRAEM